MEKDKTLVEKDRLLAIKEKVCDCPTIYLLVITVTCMLLLLDYCKELMLCKLLIPVGLMVQVDAVPTQKITIWIIITVICAD